MSGNPDIAAGESEPGASRDQVWERLESQITWYDTRARSNQVWFKALKVLQIVIAAAIPVVAAAGGSAAAAGTMGAAIVVFEGLQQLFQFQQNWTSYRSTCETLKHEKFLYVAGAELYEGQNRAQLLAIRIERLVSAETAAWAAQQTSAHAKAGSQAPES
jgi:hypothetical protein